MRQLLLNFPSSPSPSLHFLFLPRFPPSFAEVLGSFSVGEAEDDLELLVRQPPKSWGHRHVLPRKAQVNL